MFHQAQATDYIDLLLHLEALAVNSHVDSLAINVAGTGWAVGDVFDINGGTTVLGLNATGEVLAEAGGIPSLIRVFNGGAYTVNPGVAATTTAIFPATGINLTVDTTVLATGWSVDRAALVSGGPERELLIRGIGAGADEIFMGFQTNRDTGSGTFLWDMAGATGFDNGELFADQPGSSKANLETDALFTPLNNGIIDYWFVIDGFHVKGVFKSGSSYTNLYAGFINTFATPAEYPYPLLVMGCETLGTTPFNTSTIAMSGMTDPIAHASNFSGPGALREVDGNWYRLANSQATGSNRFQLFDLGIWPQGFALSNDDADVQVVDRFVNDSISAWQNGAIFSLSTFNPPSARLQPTPDSGGDIQFLWPTVILQMRPSQVFLGELIDAFPCYTIGIGAVSEDTFTDVNGDVFIIFQNCNRTDVWTHFAIKRT
ncbi:MAG: hypothetical protein KAQ88_04745 [Hyphomicrobiaceae bacterium]|nr:hypothetical protein [Hyphomicrobiaceae bacterium]